MSADVADAVTDDQHDGDEDLLEDIPDELRFDLDERTERSEEGRLPFALGSHRLYAHKPKDYTMLALASAMSGMADQADIAYAVMLFCHDAFDGPTRNLISRLDDVQLNDLITSLCNTWGEDTSTWKQGSGNREQRRADAKKRRRK